MAVCNYVFKSVNDLTDEEIQQYIALFNGVFHGNLSAQEFREKFARRIGPNSYFVFLVDEREGIVGSIGAIEVPYTFQGRHYKFALAVDGMIAPYKRSDWLALKRMFDLLVAELGKRDFVYMFTKPNNNSYLYLKQLGGLSDTGDLVAYGLPLRPCRLLDRRIAWLDYPWRGLVWLFARLGSLDAAFVPSSIDELAPQLQPTDGTGIHRERDAAFLRTRYENPRYRWIARRDRFVIYDIRLYEGRMACIVLEAWRLTFGDWLAFLNHLFKAGSEVEIVLHVVGRPSFHFPLVRIPRFLLPNKFHIIGKSIGQGTALAGARLCVDLSDFEMV